MESIPKNYRMNEDALEFLEETKQKTGDNATISIHKALKIYKTIADLQARGCWIGFENEKGQFEGLHFI